MASEAKRTAAGILVKLIDAWWSEFVDSKENLTVKVESMEGHSAPKTDLAVRVELLRLKETFERVEKATEDPHPEGWTEGNPQIGPCNCNECVDKKTKKAKEEGRLKDPTTEEATNGVETK